MIYSGRTPYGTNQVQSSSLAITVENTDVAVFTTGSLLVSGSLTSLGGFTGSFSGSFTGSANLTTLTSSNALVTGNVVVLGTASINTLVINQTQLSTGSNQLGDNVDDFQTLYGTVTIPTGSLTVTGSTIISSSAATQLQVGSNLLFVSSSENVGIGTTTPSYKLHIQDGSATSNGQIKGLVVENTSVWNNLTFGIATTTGKGNANAGFLVNGAVKAGFAWDRTRSFLGFNNWDYSNFDFSLRLNSNGSLSYHDSVSGGAQLFTILVNGNTLIGTTTDSGFKLDVNGTGRFSGNLTITGSATNSLLVKGSGATSATTTLRVENSSASPSLTVLDNGFVGIGVASPNFRLDVSGSSEFIGNIQVTGSTFISASASTSSAALQVYKSGSTVLNVEGSSGQLFSITDSLTGSLFSVNTVAGLPVIEAFSDNTVNIGKFGVYPIKVAATGTLAVITGSLLGTASLATTASFALTASLATTALTASFINPLTQSVFISGSVALRGNQSITGSLFITASAGTGSALTVYKSGSTVVSIQGSQGELFSITDSLSGSLFSVSNISGLPILEVFSDNTTLVGNYLDPMLVTTQLVTANSGSTTIYSLPTASYDGAFYDYVVRSGSNSRAGQIMAIWSGSSVNYTDNSTTDFGSTANLSFNVIVSGSNMVLRSTVTTGSWTVKTIIRSI